MKLPSFYDIFRDKWGEFQTIWIYSDPHFNDPDLEAGVPNRPSAQEQVDRINKCVGKNDAIIFLGDIGDVNYLRKVKGYKVLLTGNHDGGATKYKRVRECVYYDGEKMTEQEAHQKVYKQYPREEGWTCSFLGEHHDFHRPFITYDFLVDNKLCDEVYEGPVMVSEKLLLSHEPISVSWAYNIHGHDHAGKNTEKSIQTHYNCCSDVINYTPVHLGNLLKSGICRNIQSVHRQTIDRATERRKKGK